MGRLANLLMSPQDPAPDDELMVAMHQMRQQRQPRKKASPPLSIQSQPPVAFPPSPVGGGYGDQAEADENLRVMQMAADLRGPVRGTDRNYLEEVMNASAPNYPSAPPQRAALPQRPQRSAWDFLPAVLAGAGDVVTASGGGRSNYFGQMRGMQEAQYDRAHQDNLMQAATLYDNQKAQYDHNFRVAQMQQQGLRGQFDRAYRAREMEMMEELMDRQKGAGGKRETEKRRQVFMEKLMGADTADELRLEAAKLAAMYPEDSELISSVADSLSNVFTVEEEHLASQPSRVKEQLEGTIGKTATGWLGEKFSEATEPEGGKGLPVFGSERGYRWLYGTPAFPVPLLGDAGEAMGLWDLGGQRRYAEGGEVMHPAPSKEEIESAEREFLRRSGAGQNKPSWPRYYSGYGAMFPRTQR